MNMSDERKKELEAKITDLERSLANLRTKLNEEQLEEQHQAIDNLDVYLDEIDHKYSHLKDFWTILTRELKELFGRDSQNN
ncbi:MAG: hypothetical protein AAF462_08525 [Thermodesulfobacteriota bacterium]